MLHPRQEAAASKISQLLYSLAVEHCVATGEVLEAGTAYGEIERGIKRKREKDKERVRVRKREREREVL